jgi:hypothetical protein
MSGTPVAIYAFYGMGYKFDRWTQNADGSFANANQVYTSFTPGYGYVTITANFSPAAAKAPAAAEGLTDIAPPTPSTVVRRGSGRVHLLELP